MMYDDTIAAIATPPGEGGVGIVRLSGSHSLPIAQAIFRPRRPGPLRSHRVRYGQVVDPSDGRVVDEVLAVLMQAPRSFTGEDVVELSGHGGTLVMQEVLGLTLAAGARLAHPGEFSMRAFLNGRMDLTQAEAILDIIQAQTSTGLALAQAQLGGWLAREVRRIRTDLLEALAYVTVTIDFPEDEVDPQDLAPTLTACRQAVEHLLATADQGVIYRQGARVVLLGRPNVGKSSLLNALLRTNRAIVTPIPGTTRDTLEETANLDGIPVVLVDTAGISESADPIERLGVERSREALALADLALLVLDIHQPVSRDDRQIAELTLEKPTLVVWNKADLEPGHAPPHFPFAHPHLVGNVATSALTGAGMEDLVRTIVGALSVQGTAPGGSHLVTNPRHREVLSRAAAGLRAATEGQAAGVPADLLAGDLTTALNALGEITGETITDDLLDTIFSRFCIGK
ncbi:MAG: tRNA uridine-5-carboxymethylaminomethyl(34) synthesis GTPase MnmE [Chloroflexaceae bacterium]|nr:tRNA uridine-5-carboxymethylaminomethyl(34) synthesis GTPase MnmE [Chloroflexaceae bacterium]